MSTHKSSAIWKGNLKEGNGTMNVGEGAWEGSFSAKSRFEGAEEGSSPEELIAAAHAGCFSMAFAHALAEEGFEPVQIDTKAAATIEKTSGGFAITKIHLSTKGKVNGIDNNQFQEIAKGAKENCPVSKALKQGVDISMDAELLS
ncbi:MAG: OsmC family protein [Bacteroidales bacterium]|nr:OsmC family protein [Bacteroidales bacterium]MCF8343130.1 OsmC family protein [Bacteroidales bacterium]MCF8351268.1 OsmC family protein [Bacteroidales bacterium]MCF8376098.1 OsmC family protein [Bacteroidales bacterium]MCF8400369.1 OsmC family protein [Bacteroidales bacterium]